VCIPPGGLFILQVNFSVKYKSFFDNFLPVQQLKNYEYLRDFAIIRDVKEVLMKKVICKMKSKILIIEDDKKLNDGIKLALRREYLCDQAFNLKEAKELYNVDHYDVILLDVNLPDGNGFDFMEEIRKTDLTPIILLTANKMEMDIVSGLEMGANDYITKPFSLAVLRARVAVQLRNIAAAPLSFSIGDFYFDFQKMEFRKKDSLLELSKTEQRLLKKLVENMGRSISREQLTDYIWQGENEFVDEHALTVVVNRLRNKLGDDNQNYIKTVYGVGYMWVRK